MTTVAELISPLVTESDRQWALDQSPTGAALGDGRCDTTVTLHGPALDWRWFVQREMQAFQRYFANERKTRGDWSRLWRRGWWPKAEPWKFGPRPQAPTTHPFWRMGSAGYRAALGLATPAERALFERIGVAQFHADDPRVGEIRNAMESAQSGGRS